MRHAAAICCWVLASYFAALIPASLLAARGSKGSRPAVTRARIAAGIAGAGGLAWAGAALW